LHSSFASKHVVKAVFLAGFLAMAGEVRAADWATPVTGNLLGTVVDATGTPQIGASVRLFNKYDRIVARTLSAPDGKFAFAGLAPDFYSLRVSLESFVPAFRNKIAIRGGANSMLQINMATLFSSIQFGSTIPLGAMSNDWKWVLRSSPATRPVTRLLPDDDSDDPAAALHPKLFSGTHMLVGISGGDAGLVDSDSATSDLSTQFALSTNLYGKSMLQLAGRVGQSVFDTGTNTFAICAIYTPSAKLGLENPPEIALTVSQVRMGSAAQGAEEGALMLRTMSISVYQTTDPVNGIHLEYGVSGESVDYMQHASRITPFARVTADIGPVGTLVAAYSDGGRPDELTEHSVAKNAEPEEVLDDDLAQPVNALARMPEISMRDSRLEIQRTRNVEAGLSKTAGSRTYSFSTFYERVSNGRINVAGDLAPLASGSLLSDGVSTTSIYNIGSFNRNGYNASIDQRFGDKVAIQGAYGRMGAFTAANELVPGIGSQSDFLSAKNHNIASLGVRAKIPKTGTRLSAHYGWADPRASIPQHTFTTQNITLAPGLNIVIRQPLPSFFGLPGHLELMGDLRNLLSQGYLPLDAADGQRLLIVQSPKAILGGVSITF
jgi:hypothetical protein